LAETDQNKNKERKERKPKKKTGRTQRTFLQLFMMLTRIHLIMYQYSILEKASIFFSIITERKSQMIELKVIIEHRSTPTAKKTSHPNDYDV